MHAVARLALHGLVDNIQASWVKMGEVGVAACLAAGANDVGGTLMNESITRAAGAEHGQELPPERMDELIRRCGREPRQRTTLYETPDPRQVEISYRAPELAAIVNTPAQRYERKEKQPLVRRDDPQLIIAS
jgi:FO synthase